jgi:hypothetical protein
MFETRTRIASSAVVLLSNKALATMKDLAWKNGGDEFHVGTHGRPNNAWCIMVNNE